MTNVDFGRYKRIVQYFWDPEPRNDEARASPVWCLGRQYASPASATTPAPAPAPAPAAPTASAAAEKKRSAASRASSSCSSAESTAHKTTESFSSAELVTPSTSISGSPREKEVVVVGEEEEEGEAAAAVATTDAHALGDATASGGDSTATADDGGWPASFLDDFESRIWLTYRSNFPPIPKSREPGAAAAISISVRLRSQLLEQGGFTSDTGWGCMIRSGQSLLANALVMLRFGRDWRRGSRSEDERRLLSLFADDPRAVFSIHRFVEHGASACGKHPGEWFGPSATARCIHGDGADVYEDKFMEQARPDGTTFLPTLLLLGIRLGIDRVTPVYWEALKDSLRMPQSIGIAGGRPSSSHYFVGVQGPYFFYLDPHHTRPALPLHADARAYTPDDVGSCHTRRLRRLHIGEMDPSMLIGFLIRDAADWQDWRRRVTAAPGGKPIVHVADRATAPSVVVGGGGDGGGPADYAEGGGHSSLVDEVEILEDDDEDDDDVDVITIAGLEA